MDENNFLLILHTVCGDDGGVVVHHEPSSIMKLKDIGNVELTYVMERDRGDPSHAAQNPCPRFNDIRWKPYLPVVETEVPSLHHCVKPKNEAIQVINQYDV